MPEIICDRACVYQKNGQCDLELEAPFQGIDFSGCGGFPRCSKPDTDPFPLI
ncbi:MAG: hypothetical protein ACYCX4_04425 [Bacillota bacterium]